MHRDAISAAGGELVRFARGCGLIRGEWIAIDGSKFRARKYIRRHRLGLAVAAIAVLVMEPTFCQMDPVIRAISGRMRAGSGFFGETQPGSQLVDLLRPSQMPQSYISLPQSHPVLPGGVCI